MKTIVLAAGGTGGHLFPAQALASALRARGWRVVLATDARAAAHATDFPAEQVVALPAATVRGRNPVALVRAALTVLAGVRAGRRLLDETRPDLVVGFGGYPSLPALLAALTQGRRTLIHEQNAVMGRANRFLAPYVTALACGFEALAKAPPRIAATRTVTGNPVRPDIAALAGKGYAAPTDRIHVLVTGGSQGARLLSDRVPEALAALPEPLRGRLRVAQQARPERLEAARATYARAGIEADAAPFFGDMAQRLAWAHLVIGRAGASTVTELSVAGRPSLLVPLGAALDDDQGQNARLLAEAGAAVVLREGELDALEATLEALLGDPARLAAMAAGAAARAKPDAAERLADLAERLAQG